MAFTKVAPAGIGTEPGDGYRIGDSFLHATPSLLFQIHQKFLIHYHNNNFQHLKMFFYLN